jgi:hypothetical protein
MASQLKLVTLVLPGVSPGLLVLALVLLFAPLPSLSLWSFLVRSPIGGLRF